MRQIFEKYKESGIKTHHLFADFKAAYDRINRTEVLKALSDFNDTSKLMKLIMLTLFETISTMQIQGILSTFFKYL